MRARLTNKMRTNAFWLAECGEISIASGEVTYSTPNGILLPSTQAHIKCKEGYELDGG